MPAIELSTAFSYYRANNAVIGNRDALFKSLLMLNPSCRLRTDSGDLFRSFIYLQLGGISFNVSETQGGMAGVSSEPQHCWGLERVPREFEGPTYILQNAQVFFIQIKRTPCELRRVAMNHNELQEEVSLGRNRKNNVKVCDGPNVSRNHLKLIRWPLSKKEMLSRKVFWLNLLKRERPYLCTDNRSKRLRTGDASDWRNVRWMVKDLGGQNGTYVNRSLFHELFIKLHRKPSSLE